MKDEKRTQYSYYSNVLNKVFSNKSDLIKAEDEYYAKRAEKETISNTKRNDASKVQKAFSEYNKAKKDYNLKVSEAQKIFTEKVSDAKSELNLSIKSASENLKKYETTYNEAIKAFIDKHPEGYHLTLTDNDAITTLDGVGAFADASTSIKDLINHFINMI